MNIAVEDILANKIIPVIKLEYEQDARPLGEALVEGGLPVAEITFRTKAAEGAIRSLVSSGLDICVGAGTVTSLEQAKRAQQAGASFVVMPGICRPVIEYCLDNKLPVFAGACTPSEIMVLMEYNLSTAKFFPAQVYGGLAAIKALSGPFPKMRFMPTGGVGPDNVREYLAFDRVPACGGSWMVPSDRIAAHDFAAVAQLVRQTVALVRDVG